MPTPAIKRLAPLLGLLLFAGALAILHHELSAYRYHDVAREVAALPASRLLLAFGLTILSYLALTGYDAVAVSYAGRPLPYPRIALASFIGYAVSNTAGHSFITGGSIRYRLYSAWGLSTVDITKVVAVCIATFWLGVATVGGAIFLAEPLAVAGRIRLPPGSLRLLGAVLLAAVGGYFLWTAFPRRPLTVRGYEFPVPSTRLALSQAGVAVLDWCLAAGVLYVLLPPGTRPPYPSFLAVYMLSHVAGLASGVPGGLGVFETGILLFLTPALPAASVAGALLAYRGLYNLLPLAAAATMLAAYELLERREAVARAARAFGRWIPRFAPDLLALATFVGGAVLVFSGALPAAASRLARLERILPLPFLEASHFLGSIAGLGLLFLARGLQLRLDSAWQVAAGLLAAGIVASLGRGLDYEEALVLALLLGIILPCRRLFYRKGSLAGERFTAEWSAAIAFVLVGSAWLGIFAYKHVAYSHELFWRFVLHGNAPRFLRATVGAVGVALIAALYRLTRPAAPEPSPPGPAELARAREIIHASPRTYASLALLGDKSLIFGESGRSFLMYGVQGRSWVVLGDPVGPGDEHADLVWRFHESCDRHNGWAVFYEAGAACLPLYVDLGLSPLKLGEEGRVALPGFSTEGSGFKGMRNTERRLSGEGFRLEVVPEEEVPALLPELRRVSDAWLAVKKTREKGFSLGFFDEDYLRLFPAAVIRKGGEVFAFANLLRGAGKEELSIDLMRYRPGTAHGLMDYLFLHLMLWGKREGYLWFNLGMAPLSGLESEPLRPLWNRLGALLYRHGEHFYNFRGLRGYKEKFAPRWEPKYLVSPGGIALTGILANLGTLISRGVKGIVAK